MSSELFDDGFIPYHGEMPNDETQPSTLEKWQSAAKELAKAVSEYIEDGKKPYTYDGEKRYSELRITMEDALKKFKTLTDGKTT